MCERPELDARLDARTFRNYYYLKEELTAFCKAHGLPVSGGKIEIADRVAHYLDTGEALPGKPPKKAQAPIGIIDESAVIEPDFVCSEVHRAFFKEKIGKKFSFHVAFQQWLKSNAGKTYADALAAYHRILEEKKRNPPTIDKQFEYNTYIRAFFAENKGSALADAIRCWKYKKSLPGHNRYEASDRAALEIPRADT